MPDTRRHEDSSEGRRAEDQNRLRSRMLRNWARSLNAMQKRPTHQPRKLAHLRKPARSRDQVSPLN